MTTIKIGKVDTIIKGVELIVSGNNYSFCQPQEELDDVNEYEALQLEFVSNGNNIKFDKINKELKTSIDLEEYLHDDIFNSNVYGNVPLDIAKDVYSKVTTPVKTETKKKVEEKEVVDEKKEKPKTKGKQKEKEAKKETKTKKPKDKEVVSEKEDVKQKETKTSKGTKDTASGTKKSKSDKSETNKQKTKTEPDKKETKQSPKEKTEKEVEQSPVEKGVETKDNVAETKEVDSISWMDDIAMKQLQTASILGEDMVIVKEQVKKEALERQKLAKEEKAQKLKFEKLKEERINQIEAEREKKRITKKQAVKKVNDVINALNSKFFELEDEVHSMIVSVLAGEHLLLIGEPGIGKSYLAQQLSEVTGGVHFGIQLQDTTTPDELFGAVDHEEYIKGNLIRNSEGKLIEADFAYLDEIFKSNSAILNNLLQILNERTYDNGGKVNVPLLSAIGASNEFPEEDELDALYDRFLIRHLVTSVKNRYNRKKLLLEDLEAVEIPKIELGQLLTIQDMVSKVKLKDNVIDTMLDIIEMSEDEGVYISPRRYKKSLSLLKACAFIAGRDEIVKDDLEILKHVFWSDIEDKNIIENIIDEFIIDKVKLEVLGYARVAKDVIEHYNADSDIDNASREYGGKITQITVNVQRLLSQAEDEETEKMIIELVEALKIQGNNMFNKKRPLTFA